MGEGKQKLFSIDDFYAGLEASTAQFSTLQLLNEQGEVVQPELLPDLSDEELLELMKQLIFCRIFDEESISYSQQARLGFYAPSRGQEAAQAASHFAFEKEDWLYGSYRDIPQLMLHGASVADAYLWSLGHVSGSQFAQKKGVKAMIPQIIIGAQMVQAQGNALGQKLKGEPQVTFAYIGDGGTSQGDTYEAMNFAGRYQSPIIFFFQNNGYAISTPVEIQTKAETLAQKAIAAGLPSLRVDGNDPLAVYLASHVAREHAVNGGGPVVIEMLTQRMKPHSTMGDDPLRYRTQESLDEWELRDPIDRFSHYLTEKGLLTEDLFQEFVEEAKAKIQAGMEEAEAVEPMTVEESLAWTFGPGLPEEGFNESTETPEKITAETATDTTDESSKETWEESQANGDVVAAEASRAEVEDGDAGATVEEAIEHDEEIDGKGQA